jgi:hypothetical protein
VTHHSRFVPARNSNGWLKHLESSSPHDSEWYYLQTNPFATAQVKGIN